MSETKKVVYVYHETNDDAPFGDMLTKVFAEHESAVAFLKERVELYFGKPWDECRELVLDPENDPDEEENTFSDEYVSYGPTRVGCCFWEVQKCVVN